MKSVKSNRPAEAELLSLVEEKVHLGLWSWDFINRTAWWSDGLFVLFGLDPTASEPSFALYNQITHPADRLDLTDPTEWIARGTISDREFRIIRPDGELRWISSHTRLIHDFDGRPAHLIGTAFDVTRYRRALQGFEERDVLFDALRELLNAVFWRTAADGSVIDPYEWWRSTGQAGHTEGWDRLSAVHPEDREAVRDAWDTACRDGTPYAASFRVSTANGYVPAASRGVPQRNGKGEIQGWVGFTVGTGAAAAAGPSRFVERLTPSLVRAARGYLDWTAHDLADKGQGLVFNCASRRNAGDAYPAGRQRRGNPAGVRDAGLRFVQDQDGRAGIVGS